MAFAANLALLRLSLGAIGKTSASVSTRNLSFEPWSVINSQHLLVFGISCAPRALVFGRLLVVSVAWRDAFPGLPAKTLVISAISDAW